MFLCHLLSLKPVCLFSRPWPWRASVFAAVELAGEVVGIQMGLGFASFFNPALNTQSTAVARFFGHMAAFLFIVMNGHLIVLMAVIKSFEAFPVEVAFFEASSFEAAPFEASSLEAPSRPLAWKLWSSRGFVEILFAKPSRHYSL